MMPFPRTIVHFFELDVMQIVHSPVHNEGNQPCYEPNGCNDTPPLQAFQSEILHAQARTKTVAVFGFLGARLSL
jgi:hypothetical protein